jgi:hypothetical protein
MLDTIILLTGGLEGPALAAPLLGHRPDLTVHTTKTLADLDALAPATLKRARLIGFLTPVIVPGRILGALGYGAYNFHPGPPHYPGWLPSHFAVYDGATQFGVTAHVMAERVDSGPIVGGTLFAVPAGAGVVLLDQLAFVELARLYWRLAKALATQSEPLPELAVQWSGRKTTRRMYAAMCEIPADIAKDELERRIRAFGGPGGPALTTTLHGHRFSRTPPEMPVDVEAPSIVPADRRAVETA